MLLASSVLLAACGSAVATEPIVTSVAGTWNLVTVNGSPLPFTYQASDPTLVLLSKKFVIVDAGTFTYSFSIRATDVDGTVTSTSRSDAGTQTLANNVVTFRFTGDGTVLTGAVSGSTMTILSGEFSQVFVKQ